MNSSALNSLLRSPFDAPALIARHGHSSILTPDGELLDLSPADLKPLLREFPAPLLVHGPASLRILGLPAEPPPAPWFDLLELFLFVYPARPVPPTARGLAMALEIIPHDYEGIPHAGLLHRIARHLLDALAELSDTVEGDTLRALLIPLCKGGWSWAGSVAEALGLTPSLLEKHLSDYRTAHEALSIWKRLPQWEEDAPRAQPGNQPVAPQEARQRLHDMLGSTAEPRPGQADFASVSCHAFTPRDIPQTPNIVLAEAGTGTGKTMGYIAPASLWAEKNDGPVWISTYTRLLQRQIEQELVRLYPDPAVRKERAVIRKGRENYLCLLNFEDYVKSVQNRTADPHISHNTGYRLIPLALLVHWIAHSSDGDIMGGDLPGWFGEIFGHSLLSMLADRRGECIYGACPHYQSCFIEHTIRRARQADLVIANHALVLSQTSWNAQHSRAEHHRDIAAPSSPCDMIPDLTTAGLADENGAPTHYIFDEGHHIPDAADNAFSLVFSGLETADLRRWLLGAEGRRSRARGLLRRFEDILAFLPELKHPMEQLLRAAQHGLPAPGWAGRLAEKRYDITDDQAEKNPVSASDPHAPNAIEVLSQEMTDNASEVFLGGLKQHLAARTAAQPAGRHKMFDQDTCDLHPVPAHLLEQAETLQSALDRIARPLKQMTGLMAEKLALHDDSLDATALQRLETAIRSLHRRALTPIEGWKQMMSAIMTPSKPGTVPVFIDFIKREKLPFSPVPAQTSSDARTEICYDIGLHRHWVDPTIPFAQSLQQTTHGLLITSATLRDRTARHDEEESWEQAEQRLGASWFLAPPRRAALLSPFDYARQTRAYIITDIGHEIAPLSRAFQQLFECAGGGALGLFTAISRLKEVYHHIHEPLGHKHITLYAQHCDAMNNATLVDIFRTEKESCLLGTDAMRDGVDVPGQALRMVVFERTPWPRPDILHRERRRLLSGGRAKSYDDQIARMRIRQAFGRLIRKSDDYGVFVMLDRQTPTRLFTAFPDGVPIKRLTLAEALEDIAGFLKQQADKNRATEPPSA